MLKRNDLLEKISNSEIERRVRLSPVSYKYICWNQINKYIEPINIDCSELTLEQSQDNIRSFIAYNDLLRTKIFDINNIYVMKMVDGKFPVYKIKNSKEKMLILFKMAKEMMDRSIFERLLYDGAFFVYNNIIEFTGIFNHVITDGAVMVTPNKKGVDLKYYEFDYRIFEKCMDSLFGNRMIDFQEYVKLKGKLVDIYLCDEMEYLHFSFKRQKRICNHKLTLEEYWAKIITSFVKNALKMDSIPLYITSGGRMIDGTILTSFGDFHDDYIFVVKDEAKFIQEFQYYRNNPYLNAEQYKEQLFQNIVCKEFMEPVSMCVKWKIKELDEYRKRKIRLPNHERKYVLGFEILVDKSLKEVQVNIKASRKIQALLDHCEVEFERLIDEYMK